MLIEWVSHHGVFEQLIYWRTKFILGEPQGRMEAIRRPKKWQLWLHFFHWGRVSSYSLSSEDTPSILFIRTLRWLERNLFVVQEPL